MREFILIFVASMNKFETDEHKVYQSKTIIRVFNKKLTIKKKIEYYSLASKHLFPVSCKSPKKNLIQRIKKFTEAFFNLILIEEILACKKKKKKTFKLFEKRENYFFFL